MATWNMLNLLDSRPTKKLLWLPITEEFVDAEGHLLQSDVVTPITSSDNNIRIGRATDLGNSGMVFEKGTVLAPKWYNAAASSSGRSQVFGNSSTTERLENVGIAIPFDGNLRPVSGKPFFIALALATASGGGFFSRGGGPNTADRHLKMIERGGASSSSRTYSIDLSGTRYELASGVNQTQDRLYTSSSYIRIVILITWDGSDLVTEFYYEPTSGAASVQNRTFPIGSPALADDGGTILFSIADQHTNPAPGDSGLMSGFAIAAGDFLPTTDEKNYINTVMGVAANFDQEIGGSLPDVGSGSGGSGSNSFPGPKALTNDEEEDMGNSITHEIDIAAGETIDQKVGFFNNISIHAEYPGGSGGSIQCLNAPIDSTQYIDIDSANNIEPGTKDSINAFGINVGLARFIADGSVLGTVKLYVKAWD